MKTILSFLSELSENNNRDWFTENKGRYQEAMEEFKRFTVAVHAGICGFDPTLKNTDPLKSIFRIYKDVRFSRDKTPYKTHFGCWLTKGGRKFNDAGYYFHLQPSGSFMAAGVHSPPSDLLKLIREDIAFQPQSYLKTVAPIEKGGFERGGMDDMLKKGPAGFTKDFEHMELLKYKHHVFSKNYSDQEVLSNAFPLKLSEDYQKLQPLVAYLNEAMSFSGNE